MLEPLQDNTPDLLDAWKVIHPKTIRDATCGIFDRNQWEEGPHCRDYFFVSNNFAHRLDSITVNLTNRASDHQPVLLTIS